MTTSKSIGHTGGLADVDYQMCLPNSNSSEKLASILSDYNDGPPSPPPVIMETQPEQSLQFSRYRPTGNVCGSGELCYCSVFLILQLLLQVFFPASAVVFL